MVTARLLIRILEVGKFQVLKVEVVVIWVLRVVVLLY